MDGLNLMDNGLVTFFDISACGFYRLKKDSKELDHKFGSITETILDLSNWLVDKKFEQTIPWNVNSLPGKPKIYCRGIAVDPKTQDAVIVIYRAVGDSTGNIHGVKVGADVGPKAKGTVVAGTEHDGDKIIWGQPCYYWFIPKLNKMASINFPHSSSDTSKLCTYIREHVNNNSLFGERKQTTREMPNSKDPTNTTKIVSTTFPHGTGKDKCNCLFKLDVKELKVETMKEDLDKMRPKITHTIIRDVATNVVSDTRTPFLKVASEFMPSLFGEAPITTTPAKIEVVVDGAPSIEELNKLFTSRETALGWSDVGFRMSGSNSTTWLTEYTVRTNIEIISSDGEDHYSPEVLLNEINRIRDDLIEPLFTFDAEKQEGLDLESSKSVSTGSSQV
jgi:hypothetical protein